MQKSSGPVTCNYLAWEMDHVLHLCPNSTTQIAISSIPRGLPERHIEEIKSKTLGKLVINYQSVVYKMAAKQAGHISLRNQEDVTKCYLTAILLHALLYSLLTATHFQFQSVSTGLDRAFFWTFL